MTGDKEFMEKIVSIYGEGLILDLDTEHVKRSPSDTLLAKEELCLSILNAELQGFLAFFVQPE